MQSHQLIEVTAFFNVVLIFLQRNALRPKGDCPLLDGEIRYIVEQLDFDGDVLERSTVYPDNCTDRFCTAKVLPETCTVQVKATNKYGSSDLAILTKGEFFRMVNVNDYYNKCIILVGEVKLTTANAALLVIGMMILGLSIVLCIVLIVVIAVTRRGM